MTAFPRMGARLLRAENSTPTATTSCSVQMATGTAARLLRTSATMAIRTIRHPTVLTGTWRGTSATAPLPAARGARRLPRNRATMTLTMTVIISATMMPLVVPLPRGRAARSVLRAVTQAGRAAMSLRRVRGATAQLMLRAGMLTALQ